MHDWNLTSEKEVMARTRSCGSAYVGNHATNQDSYDDLNQMIPSYVWYMTTQDGAPTGSLANQLRQARYRKLSLRQP